VFDYGTGPARFRDRLRSRIPRPRGRDGTQGGATLRRRCRCNGPPNAERYESWGSAGISFFDSCGGIQGLQEEGGLRQWEGRVGAVVTEWASLREAVKSVKAGERWSRSPVLCPGGTASQHSGVPRSIGIASAVVVSGLASFRE